MCVVVEPSSFNVKDYFWSGRIGLLTLLDQTAAMLFLTYFLIISGDSFRRKLLELAGASLSGRKITLQVLDEITDPIQSYLQVQIFTSALVAVLTGLALMAQGLQNAAVLGIVACVLNLVPYVGAQITASTSGLVAFFAGWRSRHGTGHLRGFSRDPYAGWQFADALADQSQQPTQAGRRVRRIARLGLALGSLGLTAWCADFDDGQGRL